MKALGGERSAAPGRGVPAQRRTDRPAGAPLARPRGRGGGGDRGRQQVCGLTSHRAASPAGPAAAPPASPPNFSLWKSAGAGRGGGARAVRRPGHPRHPGRRRLASPPLSPALLRTEEALEANGARCGFGLGEGWRAAPSRSSRRATRRDALLFLVPARSGRGPAPRLPPAAGRRERNRRACFSPAALPKSCRWSPALAPVPPCARQPSCPNAEPAPCRSPQPSRGERDKQGRFQIYNQITT